MEDLLECDIYSLGGERYHVQARRSWLVADIKDSLLDAYDLPEYEIQLLIGTTKLKDSDPLIGLLEESNSSRLDLCLHKSQIPLCFKRSVAERMWQGFQAHCNADGETIDRQYVTQVARFGGLFKTATRVPKLRKLPETFTFQELMERLAFHKRTISIPFGREWQKRPQLSSHIIYVDEFDRLHGTCGEPRGGDWEEDFGGFESELSLDSDDSDSSSDDDW
eukprot:TRINITY_DN76343_c0_g1_i1.p1 TRINITY_DN76343_c0_g1~~TRINITY_DN76343_c0_g1_i1.p1  ORF type:complete len:221 (-),score=23.09 TRINITY_DN76343_c0_g1_i1:528-1190(-)